MFPYQFKFRGKKLHNIESVFQAIKFPNKREQNLVLNYKGLDANNIKIATSYNWKDSSMVYWQGKAINRHSKEYQDFVDELYICALQNPLYRNIVQKVDRYILHSIGTQDCNETVFTRYEFEYMLNALNAFLRKQD